MLDRICGGHRQIVVNRAAVMGGGTAAIAFWLAAHVGTVWLQVIGCALVGMLATAFATVTLCERTDVAVEVEAPGTVTVDEPYVTTVRVVNSGTRASPPLSVGYTVPTRRLLVPPVVGYFDPVPAGASAQTAVVRSPAARGLATRGLIVAERTGPFGFFVRREKWHLARRLAVLPPAVPPLPLPALRGGPPGADGPPRPGLDVQSVREFRAGDAPRHVHWRTTARTGRLSVLERGEPAGRAIGVVLVGTSGEAAFERVVATAAATLGVAVAQGATAHAWLETPAGGSCVGPLTSSNGLQPFLVDEPQPPSSSGVARLLGLVGGGAVLVARANTTPAQWYADLCAAAAATGTEVIDVAAWFPEVAARAHPGLMSGGGPDERR